MHRGAYIFVALLALTAVLTLLLRVMVLNLDAWRGEITAYLSKALNVDIQVEELQAALDGIEPEIRLSRVSITPPLRPDKVLNIDRLSVRFDLLGSLLGWQARISDLHVSGADLLIVTDPAGASEIHGFPLVTSGGQAGFAFPAFRLEQTSVRWRNEKLGFEYSFPDVQVDFALDERRFKTLLDMRLPGELGQSLQLAIDLEGSASKEAPASTDGGLSGEVYINASGVDIAQWARLTDQAGAASGTVTTELTGDFQAGVLQHLRGEVSCALCSVAMADSGADDGAANGPGVFSLQTDLSWRVGDDGWLLALSGFSGELPGLEAAIRHVTATVDYGREGSQVALQTPAFDASVVQRTAAGEWLRSHGVEISDGQGSVRWLGSVAYPEFRQEREPPSLGRQSWRRFPEEGARFLAGYAQEYFRHLRTVSRVEASEAKLGLKQLSLRVPAWSQRVFDFDFVDMDARYIAGDPFVFATENLSLHFDGVNLSGRLMYRGGESPVIDTALLVENLPLTSIGGLLPEAGLQPGAKRWLSDAFTAGVMDTARIEMNGEVSSFPFKGQGGGFYAQGEFSGVSLRYRADRKLLQDIEASVVFANEKITATVSRLCYYELCSRSATAVLSNIAAPVVELDAIAEGPLSDVLAHLDDAGRLDLDGVVMRNLEVGGNVRVELSVTAPLDKSAGQPPLVKGSLGFNGNLLKITPLDMRFDGIEGTLGFGRSGGHSQLLTANFNGVPVTGKVKAVNGRTQLTLMGELPAEQLTRRLPVPLREAVQGVSAWRGELLIPVLRAGSGRELQVKLHSTLEGTAVDMPAPFRKASEQQSALSIGLAVSNAGSEYDMVYGDEINARFVRSLQKSPQWSGYLHFGQNSPPQLEAGLFRVTGEIKQVVDIRDWSGWAGNRQPAGQTGFGDHLYHVDLSFAELRAGDSVFGEGTVAVRSEEGGYAFEFDAPWLKGSGFLPDTAAKSVFVDLDKLFLPKGLMASTTTTLDPRTLRPIELEVTNFRRGDMQLSNLRLLAGLSSEGMRIDRFDFQSGDVLMSSSGDWSFSDDRHETRLDFSMRGENYGRSLRLLNFSEDFRGGDGAIEGRFSWNAWLGGVTAAKLKGDVSVDLKDGTIKKADLGVGRLFGLLNAGHIVRRLSLDFSDVVDRGLAFDTMTGTFIFNEGVMQIKDLAIAGPAVFMNIEGSNDLVLKKYDQYIDVVPNLRSNLPVASALLGGPIAGAVVYFFDRFTGVGSTVEDILTLRYHMHGSWDAPQIDFQNVSGAEAGQSKVKEIIRRLVP